MKTTIILAIAAAMTASVATAAGHADAVTARKAQMKQIGANIGVLGGMARGKVEYDATAAQAAADALVSISMSDISETYIAGTDNATVSDTRALPAIWGDFADFEAKWAAFGAAAEGIQAVAGNGQAEMAAAVGPLGGSCGACHKAYRAAK